MKVSVVIPVFRNAPTLQELHDRLKVSFEKQALPYELIFVDDASPDDSLEVLQKLRNEEPNVVMSPLPRNVGQQKAILYGLTRATGDCVVLMDADLQDPPEAVPLLLQKLEEGYDIVFAGRRGDFDSSFRLWTSQLFKKLLGSLLKMPNDVGLFLIMNRNVVNYLTAFEIPGPSVLSMIGTGIRAGKFSFASVPVVRSTRSEGHSGYTFYKRLKLGIRTVSWVLFKGRSIS